MSFKNMDPETVDRLSSTAMERLMSPKKEFSTNNTHLDKLCTFSPVVGTPKDAKTITRLKTPFTQRLFDATTNAERAEKALADHEKLMEQRGATWQPVNSKESWDSMFARKQYSKSYEDLFKDRDLKNWGHLHRTAEQHDNIREDRQTQSHN
jgi:hypothetical protein